MSISLFKTMRDEGFFHTTADQIYWFEWRLRRDEFNITGQAVRSNPMKDLGDLETIQSIAKKIIQTIMTTPKPYGVPDTQLRQDLITLRSCMHGIAVKVKERIRAIDFATRPAETALASVVEKLNISCQSFQTLTAQMHEISAMVEERSKQVDITLQEESIRQVLLNRLLPQIDESKKALLSKKED